MTEQTVQEWIDALVSHDGGTRLQAAKQVQASPALLNAVVARLMESLENDPLWERVLPAEALVQLGEHVDAALATILRAMTEHESRDVRLTAMGSLMKNGEKAAAAIPTLVELVRSHAGRHEDVSQLAAEALGFVACRTDAAVPALAGALADPREDLRRTAAVALGRIGPRASAAIPMLMRALEDESAVVRDAARSALEQVRG